MGNIARIFFILLVAVTAFGQHRRWLIAPRESSSGSIFPTGIAHRWVHTNIVSAVGSPVDSWVDDISGVNATQAGAARPTRLASGVLFSAWDGQGLQLSGTSFSPTWKDGTNSFVTIVFCWTNIGGILIGASAAQGLLKENTGVFRQYNNNDFGTCTTNVWYDVSIGIKPTDTNYNYWVNGVWTTNFTAAPLVFVTTYFGRSSGGSYSSSIIKEIIHWTNTIGFTDAQAMAIHNALATAHGY